MIALSRIYRLAEAPRGPADTDLWSYDREEPEPVDYYVVIGEDGGGEGRRPRPGETLREFIADYQQNGGYWGQGLPIGQLQNMPFQQVEHVEVLEALGWEEEPAVWMHVRVPAGMTNFQLNAGTLGPRVDLEQ